MKANEDFPRELGVLKPEGEETIRNAISKFAAPVALEVGRVAHSV